jgi:CPA2 family monovalent cation:H+ antiporter-2
MSGFAPEHYKEALVFLVTAGVVVPLFRRLRISPVLGFLAAGVLLGPWGVGSAAGAIGWLSLVTLEDVEQIAPLAEFGVVFLLFMIGLELSWERLVLMRRLVFGLGALQVFGCAAVLGAFALWFDTTQESAVILGFALAMSSTAIVVPVLAEIKRLGAPSGRSIFAVLLFQDLMVAPLLIMVAVLGRHGGDLGVTLVSTLLPAAAALSVVVLGGRLLLRPLFHHVVAAGSTEFFMAACLLVVIGTGVLTAMTGLSMGLGAFVAGILLAETEYRREVEVTIEPFKGLALGLFFVSVGASLDVSKVLADPPRLVGIVLGIVVVKFCVTWVVARAMNLSAAAAAEAALLLGPGGEFAFVILTAAIGAKALPADLGADVMIAVTLSMCAIPLLAGLVQRETRHPEVAPEEVWVLPEVTSAPSAIVVGFGRVGRLVAEMLQAHAVPFVAVDTNATLVKRFRAEGVEIYWGNAARPDFLARCGLGGAKALIITMDKPDEAEAIVRLARADHPDLTIVARARDAHHATLLYGLGASVAVPETIEASLQLAEAVLVELGIPMGHVIASIHEKRDEFRKILRPVAGRAEARYATKLSLRTKEAAKRKPKPAEDE